MQFINDRRAMRSQSGFTLIELLVVIAILGILAGVVVFAIGGVTDNGQAAACKVELRTLRTAAQAFRAEATNNNLYPVAITDLTGGEFLEDAPELYVGTFDDEAVNAALDADAIDGSSAPTWAATDTRCA